MLRQPWVKEVVSYRNIEHQCQVSGNVTKKANLRTNEVGNRRTKGFENRKG